MVIKDKIMNLSKKSKLIIIFVFIFLAIFVSVGLPTIARIRNRVTLTDAIPWNGEVATSYNSGSGTKSDPYIITNGNELAFFSEKLKTEDYENTYFELANDIIINEGQFKYDTNIQYILNDNIYYIKEYTNEYYSDIDLENLVGTLYSFDSFNNFKGNFNGNSFTVYGSYITEKDVDKLGLFTDLEGKINDTYFENTLIYGGQTTGGIASNTNNSTIENTIFMGYVIGNKTPNTKNSTIDISNKELTISNTKLENIVIDNNIPIIGNNITSTNVTGNYEIIGCTDCQVSINGNVLSNGSFNISLGNTITDSITISTTYEQDIIIKLDNLKYNIIYNYAVSGGLIGISNSTTINNSVNKSYVFGYSLSGGLIGLNNSTLNINRSYNTGNINSTLVSGGLLGGIENNTNVVNINNSYNAGAITSTINSGLIAEISNSNSVILNKVFDASSTSNVINKINNTNVSVNNSYYVTGNTPIIYGVVNGSFVNKTIDDLKNKDNMVKKNYLEFVDIATSLEEVDKVWIYEENALPILYLDDFLNKSITIHSSKYSWNNYSNELKTYDLIKNITVSIVKENEFATDLNIYYYIHNLETPLSKQELNNITTWTSYTDIINIDKEGKYIIYAKVVDGNDNVAYLNTDILSLDLTAPSINVTLNNKTFNIFKNNLDYVYINDYESLNVTVTDNKDTELDSYYYISDSIKTVDELNSLDNNSWIKYTDKITLSNYGTYVIYVKSTDNSKNITYVNTDYIVYGGYNNTDIYPGKNKVSFSDYVGNITDKSIITLNYEYQNVTKNKEGYNHNLISNILLPVGTKITLIDKYTNKVYTYKIDTADDLYNYNNSCTIEGCTKIATYPFSLFKETGTSDEKYFDESTYQNNVAKEEYDIIIDLNGTSITNNYLDVSLYLEVRDSLNNIIMSTLTSTIKQFNIIVNTSSSIELSSDNLPSINLNSNSTTNIKLDTSIINKYYNEEKVIDTNLENKKLGLAIYITDENGNTVSKENYNNMSFSIDENKYTPEENNIIYINLSDIVTNVSKTLVIDTKATTLNLNNGNYFIKIFNYTSIFNKYIDTLTSNELVVPLNVEGVTQIEEHSFNVMVDNQIIDKEEVNNINFNIIQSGNYTNPSIRVSLYKKNEFTAYDQGYTLVNIKDYVNNDLELIANNMYYAFKTPKKYNGTIDTYNNLVLNFKDNIENNGYKVVFELYDGDIKISQIEKKFIVK